MCRWTVSFASIVVAVSLTSITTARAQTLDRAQVSGTIRDETGAALSGVTVTLRDTATGFERTTVTESAGQYLGVLLPPGTYVVQARLAGFSLAHSDPLPVAVGDALVVHLTMQVAPLTEAIDVRAPGNTAPSLATVISQSAIVNLPINGRDYRDFALLSPTAQFTTGTRGTFRVAGQPGDYLALNVDGVDFTNNFFGEFFGSLETRNFTIPLEAVQEFKVSVGGLGTQSGRSNGGFVNVVTKSGTNDRHGSVAYFLRHHALTANDAFGNPPTGLIRHTIGSSVGGAFVPDRAFYFVAADIQHQTTPLTVTFARNVDGIAVPELGIANLGALQGQFERHQNVVAALGKVDYNITADDRLSIRSDFTRNHGDNIAGGSLILSRATSNLETFHNQGLSTVASLSSSLGARLFLETKFQASQETRPRNAQAAGPQVQISDTGTFGGSVVLPSTQDMYRYQASENVTYVRRGHELNAGADYNGFNMRNNSFALALGGGYTFPTLESFLQRQPSVYSQNFGLNGFSASDAALLQPFWQREIAAYVQDRLRPTSRLTVDAGLRYDAQINPQPQAGTAGVSVPVGRPVHEGGHLLVTYAPVPQRIPNDTNGWGPRASVAYDMNGNGFTMLKASAGVYYGRTPIIYFPLRGSGVSNTTLFGVPSRMGVTFPNTLPTTITPSSPLAALLGPPAIQYVDPDFSNPRVSQVNTSVTRNMVNGLSVEGGYIFSRSANLRIGGFRSTLWDRNLATPTEFDQFGRGINVLAAGRPDSTILQANALSSFGGAQYQAMVLSLRRPLKNRWQLLANYTLAKSTGNASTERDTEALLGPSDPFNLDADYGINEIDQRHRFEAYVIVGLPHDITIGSTWSAGSGLAFPVYSPTDVNGDRVTNDGLNPDRPLVGGQLLPRFPYHQPAFFRSDLRVSKTITLRSEERMQFIFELFNVLNTANKYADTRTQALLGSPNFRVNNQTLGPRLAQLSMRIDF